MVGTCRALVISNCKSVIFVCILIFQTGNCVTVQIAQTGIIAVRCPDQSIAKSAAIRRGLKQFIPDLKTIASRLSSKVIAIVADTRRISGAVLVTCVAALGFGHFVYALGLLPLDWV